MKKVILITGSSNGIGAETAIIAGKNGYAVCVNYVNDKISADKIVSRIIKNGGKAIAIQADISQEREVVKLFAEIDVKLGTITALVNNAGIVNKQSTLAEMSIERFKKTFEVNVIGTFLCSKEAIKRMSTKYEGKGGGIINISSGASKLGSPNEYIDYASSKGAIDTLTIGLAKEVAKENIRVNAIRPGFINTEIHKIPNRKETIRDVIPMGRIGEPIEIANTILWLLSEKSSFTNGAIIDITGGR